MIVLVVGNHGSGKSTLVEQLSDSYESINMVYDSYQRLKRQPIMMECSSADKMGLAIVGHYSMGHLSGIDSGRFAGRFDEICQWMDQYARDGWHVLVEGMVLSGSWKRFSAFSQKFPVQVVYLDVPVEECALSVAHRKSLKTARHNRSDNPVNVANIQRKHKDTLRAVENFENAGIPVERVTRSDALPYLLKIL